MVGPASRPPSAASRADQASGDPRLRRGLALLLGLVLALLPAAPAFALAWPWALKTGPEAGAELAAPGLQEIAPPLGVQQLRPLLEMHQPQLRILAPKADSLMPAGSWTLRLELNDWPLVDAGPLGLGPHLVVQLDDEPPRQIGRAHV